jgi:hypothetical protein
MVTELYEILDLIRRKYKLAFWSITDAMKANSIVIVYWVWKRYAHPSLLRYCSNEELNTPVSKPGQ